MTPTHRSALALAACLMLGLAGCGSREGGTAAAPGKTVSAPVETVAAATLAESDVTPGTVVPEQQVAVASRLMGYIRHIGVHEGDTVKAGQLLFSIDPTDIEGQVNQARAGVAQAEAALADAKKDYERFSNLYKDESVPRQTYEKMSLQYQVAQSRASAARAGLRTAEAQLRYAEVRSPIAGIVTERMASEGDLAAPGRPVLSIENAARLQVQTAVSDGTYARLKLGDEVPGGGDGPPAPVQGRIARLVAAADPASHTHLVKLDLPAAGGLQSGMFARVRFPIGSRQGVTVPRSALLSRAGIAGVFAVDGQGVAHYRMVTPGAVVGERVEILAGLAPGDRIVASGAENIDSGDRIAPAGGR